MRASVLLALLLALPAAAQDRVIVKSQDGKPIEFKWDGKGYVPVDQKWVLDQASGYYVERHPVVSVIVAPDGYRWQKTERGWEPLPVPGHDVFLDKSTGKWMIRPTPKYQPAPAFNYQQFSGPPAECFGGS